MENIKLSNKDIEFYQHIKKSYQTPYSFVIGSRNRTIDFVVMNLKKDIEFIKIVKPKEYNKTEIWVEKLRKWHKFNFYKTIYTVIYTDINSKEIARKTYKLN